MEIRSRELVDLGGGRKGWRTADDSLERSDGKVLQFSVERFVKEVVSGSVCFVCGVQVGSEPFNDEHVIPEWLLRRHDLFSREITLPSRSRVRYDRYKVPCCENCNTRLGDLLERPVSEAFRGGPSRVLDFVGEDGGQRLFCWMALLFLKTYLKDTSYRLHLDRRKGEQKLGDSYDWSGMHHVHCVARSAPMDVRLDDTAIGSLVMLPTSDTAENSFDYGDSYPGKTVFVRSGSIALLAVLNDSRGALARFDEAMQMLSPPFNGAQIREIAANLAMNNGRINVRPLFRTVFEEGEQRIVGDLPDGLSFRALDQEEWGDCLDHFCGDITPPEHRADLRAGRYTFLDR